MFVRHVPSCKYYNTTCCLATMGWFKVFLKVNGLKYCCIIVAIGIITSLKFVTLSDAHKM